MPSPSSVAKSAASGGTTRGAGKPASTSTKKPVAPKPGAPKPGTVLGTGLPPEIMVVEDSAVHRRLLLEALKRTGKPPRIDSQTDAEGAWAQIERMRRKTRLEWPVMAIIDLGLPGMGGIELVDKIRHEVDLADWPLLVLTASEDPDDIKESMMARASGYIVKPQTGEGYMELATDLVEFWIPRAMGEGASRLPTVRRDERHHEGPPGM